MSRPPLLERVGVRYFHRRSRALPKVAAADAVHHLNPEERRALRRVQAGAIARSFTAGALSALLAALAEIVAGPEPSDWASRVKYWAVVLGVAVAASIVEILFLYWDALRSVHELARVAGLDLFPDQGDDGEKQAVAAALARAALELPNPATRVFGVDPRKEASRWRLLLSSLAYKAKVSATNFAVKLVVRRALTRAAFRAYVVPIVAVPVTAAWNAAVTWMVLREARLRAMEPSAVQELVELILSDAPPLSPEGRLAAIRSVASAIVRTKDLHPNLVKLLLEVRKRCEPAAPGELDDVPAFLASLAKLTDAERQVAMQLLTVSAIVDGRLTRAERRLVEDAQRAAGLPVDPAPAERLRAAFVRGEQLPVEQVRAILGRAA